MKIIANALLVGIVLVASPLTGQVCAKHIEVPEYPPVALAAANKGTIDLIVTIGARGHVIKVDATGPSPMLIDYATQNVKQWVFCAHKQGDENRVRLRFDYRIEGAPVYPSPSAKVLIDLAEGTVVIRTPPFEMQR